MKKTCAYCGKEISFLSRQIKYCSVECRHKAQLKPVEKKTCPVCGREFVLKTAHSIYCCEECKILNQKMRLWRCGKPNLPTEEPPFTFADELFPTEITHTFDDMEWHGFSRLSQVVNFLSSYTYCNDRQAYELLKKRTRKVGNYLITYI